MKSPEHGRPWNRRQFLNRSAATGVALAHALVVPGGVGALGADGPPPDAVSQPTKIHTTAESGEAQKPNPATKPVRAGEMPCGCLGGHKPESRYREPGFQSGNREDANKPQVLLVQEACNKTWYRGGACVASFGLSYFWLRRSGPVRSSSRKVPLRPWLGNRSDYRAAVVYSRPPFLRRIPIS